MFLGAAASQCSSRAAPETPPTPGGPGRRTLGVEVLTDLHVNPAVAPLISSLSQVSREAGYYGMNQTGRFRVALHHSCLSFVLVFISIFTPR